MEKNKFYHILNFGCQMNESDTEHYAAQLISLGYEQAERIEQADVIVFNTCCVRESAEQKILGKIGEITHLKKRNKKLILVIAGCMAQKEGKNLIKKFPYIDCVIGTHYVNSFLEIMQAFLADRKRIVLLEQNADAKTEFSGISARKSSIAAWIPIMYGCNNFCTYCIVPYVRGRERSRKAEEIIAEVKCLAKEGYKEITLLGQNVNSYMRVEREQNLATGEIDSFAKLLREVNKIDGIERIRFISPHPKDFTDDVIEAIRDCDKVCKIIHLPLQSGSTEILKRMNRKYTKEQYLALVEKMKARIPGIVLSTDIIVGFPGETEDDFEDTLDVVSKVHFEQVYMFIYSRRVGTPADKMENQVPDEVKHERFDRLKKLAESQIAGNNQKYVNTIQKVLVEGKSKTNENMLTGRTETNKVVNFEGTDDMIGKIINLKIVSEHMWYLKGEK